MVAGRPGQCEHEGVQVREFSVPPIVTVGDAANLTDPVWDNAEAPRTRSSSSAPPGARGDWQPTSPAGSSATRSSPRPAGLVAAGVEPGDRVGPDEPHPLRVDAARLRDLGRRRGHRADLRDLQRRPGRLDPRRLRRGGLRGGDRRARQPWSPASGTGCPSWRTSGRSTTARVDELVARPARRSTPTRDRAGGARRSGADDLATIIYTSGTTGRPKGCVLTHRNLYAEIANAVPGAAEPVPRPGASTLLFLPLAHVFARLIQVGVRAGPGHHGAHAPTSRTWSPTSQAFRPTFVLSVPRVFEKVYNTAKQKAAGRRQGQDLRPGRAGRDRATARRWTARAARAWRCAAPARALRQAGLPQAARRARRPVPRRDLRRRAARRPARPLLPRHRRDDLRGLRPHRDHRRPPTANLPDATRIGTVGRPLPGRHRSGSPTTARS